MKFIGTIYLSEKENNPIVLVGNRSDLQENSCESRRDVKSIWKDMKCTYIETSARDNENVQDIFKHLCNFFLTRNATDNDKNEKRPVYKKSSFRNKLRTKLSRKPSTRTNRKSTPNEDDIEDRNIAQCTIL